MLKIIFLNISNNVPTNITLVSLSLSNILPFALINLITLSVCYTIKPIIPILSSNVKMKSVANFFRHSFITTIIDIVVKFFLTVTTLLKNNLDLLQNNNLLKDLLEPVLLVLKHRNLPTLLLNSKKTSKCFKILASVLIKFFLINLVLNLIIFNLLTTTIS